MEIWEKPHSQGVGLQNGVDRDKLVSAVACNPPTESPSFIAVGTCEPSLGCRPSAELPLAKKAAVRLGILWWQPETRDLEVNFTADWEISNPVLDRSIRLLAGCVSDAWRFQSPRAYIDVKSVGAVDD